MDDRQRQGNHLDFEHFLGFPWTMNMERAVGNLRLQAEWRAAEFLPQIVTWGMAREVLGRLRPLLEAEREKLADLERQHAEKLTTWQEHGAKIKDLERQAYPLSERNPERIALITRRNEIAAKAQELAGRLTLLDPQIKESRDKVRGMTALMNQLQLVRLPNKNSIPGLSAFLTAQVEAKR